MKKSDWIAAGFAVLFFGGLGFGYYSDTPTQQAKKMAAKYARDPESVRFENLQVCREQGRVDHVRGWMNAKNAFGAYTGFKPFMVSFFEGRASHFHRDSEYMVSKIELIEMEEQLKVMKGEMKPEDMTPCYRLMDKASGE